MSPGARIRVNGVERVLDDGFVEPLLRTMGLVDRPGIAVAVNGTVVPRAAWGEHRLVAGDEVEVVGAAQGG
jgi:sulfur carrier protein